MVYHPVAARLICLAMFEQIYREGGLEPLKPKKSPGRRAKLANWTKADWDKVLQRTPNP